MSDTQDPLIVLQHRMQQRQILAMMGINQWVQSGSDTINVANISAPVIVDTVVQSVSSHTAIESLNVEQSSIDDDVNNDVSAMDAAETAALNNSAVNSASISNASINSDYFDDNDTTLSPPSEPNPVTYRFDTTNTDTVTPDTVNPNTAVKPLAERTERPAAAFDKQVQSTDGYSDNSLKVAPFNLQGGRYGNWVVLVDIQALNKNSQKLWSNITQALSITCETTSFPICDGMDTAELANASLAGYVFKIGRSEDIQVAALTALPDGLEHPNLTTVPTLDEMLADSRLKRQFWEQLSDG
ncbi:hypothetical protein [Psychrobacter sp. JB385]|uniref:hypothetical protein n=1 Tax=Psychrobacter sp. JB385 TaxID=1434841 RepID=UPI00097F3DE3|nr:hypothetical protein [Psychrobacter sp. JB385]SJN26253.1 hypothetical protein CZ794_05275 [Psychrobacter sp. JB385]